MSGGKIELCSDYMEVTTKRGTLEYKNIVKCEAPAKYKVKYISGLRGQIVETVLCQRHFTVLKKRCEGAEKRSGWKSNLESEPILKP